MPHDVEQALDNAYQYMAGHGWHQGDWEDPDTGKVCLMGALAYGNAYDDIVYYGTDVDFVLGSGPLWDATDVLSGVVQERYGEKAIPQVNDDILTSEAEALGILEKGRARAAELGI